jgi:phosphate transport system substrate-binding protein
MPVAHVVAYDGIAVIVNPANKVGTLTLEQVEGIYTGKIINWKEVGGDDAKIVVVSRDTNSGTFETFKELVLGKDAKIVGNAEYTGSNGGVRQRVQMTKGAIGYAGLGFLDRAVKALEINGVAPSAETVIAKSYPISRELFMFTNGEPAPESLPGKFLGLSQTEKGREIIEEIGFVPVPSKK